MVNYYSPDSIVFMIDGCEANCSSCGTRKNTGRELTSKVMKNYIDQAALLGMKKVKFSGGEPLSRRYGDVLECIGHATFKGLKTHVMSNASYANSEDATLKKVDELKASGLGSICLSFDEPHLEYIPKSNHARMTKAALKKGLEVGIQAIVTKSSEGRNISLLNDLAESIGGKLEAKYMNIGKEKVKIEDYIMVGDEKVKVWLMDMERAGNAKLLPRKDFVYSPQGRLKCKSNGTSILSTQTVVIQSDDIKPCCSFQALNNDFYKMGDTGKTSLVQATENTNESILGPIVLGPEAIRRARNSLRKSQKPELVKIAKKRYQIGCDACQSFLTNKCSRDFLLEEFEKNTSANPQIVFDEKDVASEETANIIVDGKKIRFLDYVGPVDDLYRKCIVHNRERLKKMDKDGKLSNTIEIYDKTLGIFDGPNNIKVPTSN